MEQTYYFFVLLDLEVVDSVDGSHWRRLLGIESSWKVGNVELVIQLGNFHFNNN